MKYTNLLWKWVGKQFEVMISFFLSTKKILLYICDFLAVYIFNVYCMHILYYNMCFISSWWGQTIVNCWSRSQLGMPCTGLWFNRPPGIRPCPLYTPPVALTDGLQCEIKGLEISFYRNLIEQCGLKEREVVTRHR